MNEVCLLSSDSYISFSGEGSVTWCNYSLRLAFLTINRGDCSSKTHLIGGGVRICAREMYDHAHLIEVSDFEFVCLSIIMESWNAS